MYYQRTGTKSIRFIYRHNNSQILQYGTYLIGLQQIKNASLCGVSCKFSAPYDEGFAEASEQRHVKMGAN